MLLIRWKKNREVFLPKGHKNIGETLEDAAIRDTYEETGVRVTLLSLQIPNLATPGAGAKQGCGLNTEPVALSQRTMNDGVLKIIIWFVAQRNSMVAHDVGTQEEGEDFDPLWVGLGNAVRTLTFDDDKEIAERVIQLYGFPSL
ncbi:nudix domain-containing protein [Rutstroemia sp. NJR-2017a BBW]|nr:nudix domain-containing protein [Rutstroemia sp. NJR-2017a BBW]